MDADRFDAFVHTIAAPASRRATFGTGLAALLTRIGIDDAAARKKRRKKKKCKGGGAKCGKRCVDLATDGANCGACGFACESGGCIHGACTCPGGSSELCPQICQCLFDFRDDLQFMRCADAKDGTSDQPCTTDDDCPQRSFCVLNGRCSNPCLT